MGNTHNSKTQSIKSRKKILTFVQCTFFTDSLTILKINNAHVMWLRGDISCWNKPRVNRNTLLEKNQFIMKEFRKFSVKTGTSHF